MNIQTPLIFQPDEGRLSGPNVTKTVRYLRDLQGVFSDGEAFAQADPGQIAYEVEMHNVCGEVEGGLFFGISHLYPGKVGREYFMTKGHFHTIRNRAEYYWGIKGTGLLLLMDEQRKAWVEPVFPGSLHYIAGHVAHRLINTGDRVLSVGACWPADAGHDYDTIREQGFSVRVIEHDGQPRLVPTE